MCLLGSFARDRSGNVAIIFALLLVPIMGMIGLAVDFGRAHLIQSRTQAAVDAAALAAGRVAQVESTDKMNKAAAAATAFFDQAKPKNVVSSALQW